MNNAQLWSQQSAQWSHVGSPQRPCLEDVAIFSQLLATLNPQTSQPLACILGVTPELTQMDWPAQWQTIAVDNSQAMIKQLWRPHPSIPASVVTSDWRCFSFVNAQVDLIIGDGITTAMGDIDACTSAFREFRRILKPSGRLILRCFTRPAQVSTLADIQSAVQTQSMTSFGVLKWRLAMALADETSHSIAPAKVLQTFNALFPDRHRLAEQLGCAVEVVNTIDAYQTQAASLIFLTEEALLAQLSPDFSLEQRIQPSYPLGECCPIYSFRPN